MAGNPFAAARSIMDEARRRRDDPLTSMLQTTGGGAAEGNSLTPAEAPDGVGSALFRFGVPAVLTGLAAAIGAKSGQGTAAGVQFLAGFTNGAQVAAREAIDQQRAQEQMSLQGADLRLRRAQFIEQTMPALLPEAREMLFRDAMKGIGISSNGPVRQDPWKAQLDQVALNVAAAELGSADPVTKAKALRGMSTTLNRPELMPIADMIEIGNEETKKQLQPFVQWVSGLTKMPATAIGAAIDSAKAHPYLGPLLSASLESNAPLSPWQRAQLGIQQQEVGLRQQGIDLDRFRLEIEEKRALNPGDQRSLWAVILQHATTATKSQTSKFGNVKSDEWFNKLYENAAAMAAMTNTPIPPKSWVATQVGAQIANPGSSTELPQGVTLPTLDPGDVED